MKYLFVVIILISCVGSKKGGYRYNNNVRVFKDTVRFVKYKEDKNIIEKQKERNNL